MDLAEAQKFAPTPVNKVEATNFDLPGLENLKDTMVRNAYAFGDYLNTVPKSALDAADPSNKRDGFTTLTSYWTIHLRANDWENLCAFQRKFGNLSNEAVTMITSLNEIVRTNTKTAFSHDMVLRNFFRSFNYELAEELSLVPGLESVKVASSPFHSYAEYLERYDVAKMPPPF